MAAAVVDVVQVVELDVVAEDGADIDASSFAELEDDWKNRFLRACVIESCFDIYPSPSYGPVLSSALQNIDCHVYLSSTLAIFAVCLSYCVL